MAIKPLLLRTTAIGAIGVIMLVALEMTARWIGFGDPITYYNDAWGGMRPTPRQRLQRGGVHLTVDENGFRVARRAVTGALRILYIGDSVTWGGSMVDDAALFTEIAADTIREHGRPVYAMNAAVNGTALVNHAEIFLRGVPVDAVDILVWLFPWQDVQRAYATVSYLWPPMVKPKFALVEVIDHVVKQFWISSFRQEDRSASDFFGPDANQAHARFWVARRLAIEARNLAAIRAVAAESHRRGVPLVVGVTPVREGDVVIPLPLEATSFLQELAATGVTVFDTAALLKGPDVRRYYYDDVHFTEHGHHVVGQALGAMLRDTVARSARQ